MSRQQVHPMSAPSGSRYKTSIGAGAANLAFFVVAAIIVCWISGIHLFDPINIVSYDRDVWHHTAVLNALLESPFHAANPHVVSDIPSRSYMPWFVGLAVIGRWFGLTAQDLLGVSAALSIIVLVVGVRLFAGAYFGHRWAPLALLLVTFGSWFDRFNHTGYHTFSTMIFSASYPFAIVFAAGYVAWWLVLKALQSPTPPRAALAAIALLTAFMFATHQLQAAFAIGGMLTFAVFHGAYPIARRALIGLATLGGLLLSSTWWYYNPLSYASVGEFYTLPFASPFDWTDPVEVVKILGLGLIGIGGFYSLKRKSWRLDLLLGTAGIVAGLLILYAIGSWMVLRLLPFLVVFLQLSTVAFLFDLPRRGWSFKGALQPLLICAISALFLFNAGMAYGTSLKAFRYLSGEDRNGFPSWSPNINETAERVRAIVGDDRVVIANWTTAYPIQAHHMKVVSIPYFFPEVLDSTIRQEASRAFFAPETDMAGRCAILRDYNVAAIAYRPAMVAAEVQAAIDPLGARTDVNDLIVIRLPESGSAACAAR